ncbi:unnamed protein product [Lampetra fluviatilis]
MAGARHETRWWPTGDAGGSGMAAKVRSCEEEDEVASSAGAAELSPQDLKGRRWLGSRAQAACPLLLLLLPLLLLLLEGGARGDEKKQQTRGVLRSAASVLESS